MANPVVYIVDDDPGILDALELLLTTIGYSVRVFQTGTALLDAWSSDWVGCLLLDVSMPGISGIAVQEELYKRKSTLPIIFVTGHGDVPMAVNAMHRGAFDFIQKPYHDDELLERITVAFEVGREQSASAIADKEIARRINTLTPREREVMGHIVDGAANKVIAMDLGLSQRTIEVHRSRVMEKMQARSLAALVRMSIGAK